MRNTNEQIIKVKSGRFKGEEFRMEDELKDMPGGIENLAILSSQGNFAASNAIKFDKYTVSDAPFYYGKIGNLGYIISGKDLGLNNY